jgi:integrase
MATVLESSAALALPDQQLFDRAREYTAAARAGSTRRIYRCFWEQFEAWAGERGRPCLPASPETVALYVAHLADAFKPATIRLKMSAIAFAHKAAGLPSPLTSPVVTGVWAGIRREKGCAPNRKAALMTDDLRAMLAHLPTGPRGVRDRAIVLVGFAGGFRRSEIVGLNVDDVEFKAEGAIVMLRRSKTDQDAEGRTVGLPFGSNPRTCPVRAIREHIERFKLIAGDALFPEISRHGKLTGRRASGQAVARCVQRLAKAAGLDPARYGGHSLRSGLATQSAANGASLSAIASQTGHHSLEMVQRYIRPTTLFDDNPASRLGL